MSRSPLKANYTGRGIAAITGSVGGGHIERAAVAAEGYDPTTRPSWPTWPV
jgi:hypothetical protein